MLCSECISKSTTQSGNSNSSRALTLHKNDTNPFCAPNYKHISTSKRRISQQRLTFVRIVFYRSSADTNKIESLFVILSLFLVVVVHAIELIPSQAVDLSVMGSKMKVCPPGHRASSPFSITQLLRKVKKKP